MLCFQCLIHRLTLLTSQCSGHDCCRTLCISATHQAIHFGISSWPAGGNMSHVQHTVRENLKSPASYMGGKRSDSLFGNRSSEWVWMWKDQTDAGAQSSSSPVTLFRSVRESDQSRRLAAIFYQGSNKTSIPLKRDHQWRRRKIHAWSKSEGRDAHSRQAEQQQRRQGLKRRDDVDGDGEIAAFPACHPPFRLSSFSSSWSPSSDSHSFFSQHPNSRPFCDQALFTATALFTDLLLLYPAFLPALLSRSVSLTRHHTVFLLPYPAFPLFLCILQTLIRKQKAERERERERTSLGEWNEFTPFKRGAKRGLFWSKQYKRRSRKKRKSFSRVSRRRTEGTKKVLPWWKLPLLQLRPRRFNQNAKHEARTSFLQSLVDWIESQKETFSRFFVLNGPVSVMHRFFPVLFAKSQVYGRIVIPDGIVGDDLATSRRFPGFPILEAEQNRWEAGGVSSIYSSSPSTRDLLFCISSAVRSEGKRGWGKRGRASASLTFIPQKSHVYWKGLKMLWIPKKMDLSWKSWENGLTSLFHVDPRRRIIS